MDLIIKPFYDCPCELEIFTINGKAAKSKDFGDTLDRDKKEAKGQYVCGDMRFKHKLPTSKILQCYSITLDEYNTICMELEKKLYVGKCHWCSTDY